VAVGLRPRPARPFRGDETGNRNGSRSGGADPVDGVFDQVEGVTDVCRENRVFETHSAACRDPEMFRLSVTASLIPTRSAITAGGMTITCNMVAIPPAGGP
jgi:hypothetical protein